MNHPNSRLRDGRNGSEMILRRPDGQQINHQIFLKLFCNNLSFGNEKTHIFHLRIWLFYYISTQSSSFWLDYFFLKSMLLLSKLGKSKSYGVWGGTYHLLVMHLCRRNVPVLGVVTYFLALLANGFSCIISFKRKCVLILLLFLLMNEFSVLNSPTVNCIKSV